MPADGGEPETLPGTPLDIADYAQSTDNHDTAPEPMHTSTNASANESNVTSPTAQHGNEPSQDSAAIMPDKIHGREALSDDAATDTDDREVKGGSPMPGDRDTVSPTARSTENDGNDASSRARAQARIDPTAPDDRPTNRQDDTVADG
ncbi:hypothetical protein EIP86_001528 [Pleurotus ostreatoroseus]|nr:hypothetical protein EIP86_001528 [Pleurotus ostreatoroseus]